MAIDISDMEAIDDPHVGNRLPIETLFRAIEERWSVVADRLTSLPAHPLAYDRFPTRQDRLDAIRANVCALAPYFVNLEDEDNQPTGWALCPKPYSVADIARSGIGDDGHGHVLLVPERGAVWGGWEADWYLKFLKSAAYWLAKFRYVYAGPWTCVFGKLSRAVSGHWYGTSHTDWLSSSWLASEGYAINGEEHETTYEGGEWQRCATFEDVAAEAQDGDEALVVEAPTERPVWGIGASGIAITATASAEANKFRITDADGTYAETASEWDWCELVGVTFAITGVPAKVVFANPFGYRADLLLVYAPVSTQNGERTQTTAYAYNNGEETTTWREILGDFRESHKYAAVGRTPIREFDADFDPATGRRVVETDETGTSDEPLDREGTDVSVSVTRANEPDSFGVFPIGDPDASSPAEQATNPAGKDNRIETVETIEPNGTYEKSWGYIPRPDSETGTLLVRSNLDLAAMVEEARGFRVENGAGDNPLHPTKPGFNALPYYGAGVAYSDAGCRIVPILDFGAVFKAAEDEETEDWTGNRSHDGTSEAVEA